MSQRWSIALFAVVMALLPVLPGIPPFWMVLLDNIGLAALVALGLVLLTGVGGLTSFGQAAFCGFGLDAVHDTEVRGRRLLRLNFPES